MQNLAPCPYRQVNDDGLILCGQIKMGDRSVSIHLCRACPVAQIDCAHLRATLAHVGHAPMLIRYGSGKTEIWHDPSPSLVLERAACAERVLPVESPQECAGCLFRQELSAAPCVDRKTLVARTSKGRTLTIVRAESPVPQEQGERPVAGKIIQLDAWLSKRYYSASASVVQAPAEPCPLPEEHPVGSTD